MPMLPISETPSIAEAEKLARLLMATNDDERVELLHKLRRSLRLSHAVRNLNCLLEEPSHRPLGHAALRCLGLDRGG